MAKTWKEREETRQWRELRKENIKLRKRVSELRKKLTRLENDWFDMDSEVDEEIEEQLKNLKKTEEKADKDECPKCGSYGVHTFTLRDLWYYKCPDCESKGRYFGKSA